MHMLGAAVQGQAGTAAAQAHRGFGVLGANPGKKQLVPSRHRDQVAVQPFQQWSSGMLHS